MTFVTGAMKVNTEDNRDDRHTGGLIIFQPLGTNQRTGKNNNKKNNTKLPKSFNGNL